MGNRIGFELREPFTGTVVQTIDDEDVEVDVYQGGVIVVGDDDVDVKEALEAGAGTIVVDLEGDPRVIDAFDSRPELKRVAVDDDVDPTFPIDQRGYEDLTADELKGRLAAAGIKGSARKPELVAALEEYDLRRAEDSLAELEGGATVDALVKAAAERGAEPGTTGEEA